MKRQNLVNISMKESEAKEIDEVVITGTGAQKKFDRDWCRDECRRRGFEI